MKRALLICGTALVAAAVLVVRGNSCGHDFDFHLLSWMEVARAWHAGLVYPHWVQDANYGAGEPRLIFYPPASWMLGALLGVLAGWHAAPVLFVLLALVGAGSSMYLLACEWTTPESATLASCLYIANPYAMFVAYERTAYGELLAAAWLPLMVLFALRRRPSTAALGLSVAALWLTNSPAGVIGSYLLAMLALGMWIAEGKAWPAWRAAGGMLLGLGLAAFYIVPAAFEQRWAQISRAIDPGMRVEDSFLFARTADAFHTQVLRTASWIFVAEMAAAGVLAYLLWKQQTGGSARKVFTATLPVILFLQLPWSEWVWRHAPHLKFLQFPWRWLMALSLIGCVLASMIKIRVRFAPLLIAGLAIGAAVLFFQPCDEEDAVAAQVAAFQTGDGTAGTDEYVPAGADNTDVQQYLPLVRVLRGAHDDAADGTGGDNPEWRTGNPGSIVAKVDAQRPDGEHWEVHVVTAQAGFAVLRLMDYPAWRVTLDGLVLGARPVRQDGLMVVPVSAGSHAIRVQWSVTRDVIAGRWITAIALLALVGVMVLEHREGRV